MKVASVKPLARITNLELLHRINITAGDGSLRALAELTGLRQLEIANFYDLGEFARLSRRLTSTSCQWFKPYIAVTGFVCEQCNETSMVMLTGKHKRTACANCDATRLQKHVREWNEALRAAG